MKRKKGLAVITSFVAPFIMLAVAVSAGVQTIASPGRRAEPPQSVRLYVFDCGTLHIANIGRFRLRRDEVATTDLSVACFLVAHPKGALIWDPGAVPDTAWKPTGAPVNYHLVLPDGGERYLTMRRTLKTQLAEVGYSPVDVTYLALSHYHYDHTANANAFAGATWLVRQGEREAMFADRPPAVTMPSSYAALRNSKTVSSCTMSTMYSATARSSSSRRRATLLATKSCM